MKAAMHSFCGRRLFIKYVATYFLLSSGFEVTARPAPQDQQEGPTTTTGPTPVTETATSGGKTITGNLSPKSSYLPGIIESIWNVTDIPQRSSLQHPSVSVA